MVRNIFWGRYRLSLFKIPINLDISVYVYFKSYADQWPAKGNQNPLLWLKVPHFILTLVYGWLYLVGGYGISYILFSYI